MTHEHFFKDPELPFAECRYSENSIRQYKAHMHRTFSIGAIDQGEVIYQVEGKMAKLQAGSLALINPEILHSCNPSESFKRSYYVLHLDTDWCLQLQQSLWQTETFRPVNIILLEDHSIYQQYIRTMELLMAKGEVLEKEQMLVELAEKVFLQSCEPAAVTMEPSLKIEQLKLQLSTNLDREISMRQLSSELRANPYTLLRQFRTATGITLVLKDFVVALHPSH